MSTPKDATGRSRRGRTPERRPMPLIAASVFGDIGSLDVALRKLVRDARERGDADDEFPVYLLLSSTQQRMPRVIESLSSLRNVDPESALVRQIKSTVENIMELISRISGNESFSYKRVGETVSTISSGIDNLESLSFELMKESLDVSERRYGQLSDLVERAEVQIRQMRRTSSGIETKLEEFDQRLAAELAQARAMESSLEASRSEQSDAFRSALSQLNDEKAKTLAQARLELGTAVTSARADEAKIAEKHLSQIEGLLDKSKVGSSKVANESIASYYSNSANSERVSARVWAGIAFILGLAIAGLVVALVFRSISQPVDSQFIAILRIIAPLIGTPLFIYATLEARQHRKRSWDLEDCAITHSTIGAMIAPLPDDMQYDVIARTANRLYISGASHVRSGSMPQKDPDPTDQASAGHPVA